MAPDKLSINDPRVQHRDVTVRGRTYHYILAAPTTGKPHKATILLIHGFPDLAHGWRYQVPFLTSLGLQVIVPDQLGYGRTDAPDAVEPYGCKSMSDDLAALLDADFPQERQVLVGGHDWGGQLAWRFTEWYPERVLAVFSICTPYFRPSPMYADLKMLVEMQPTFRYQLQFASDELVKKTEEGGRESVRLLLNAMYGGHTPDGKSGMVVDKGILWDVLPQLGHAPLLEKEELEFYTDEFMRHGLRGPTNWYRVRKVNHEDEKELLSRNAAAGGGSGKIKTPALFVSATRDTALPPTMSAGMEKSFENLTRREVDASHWALTQTPEEVNGLIGEFLAGLPFLKAPKASI